MFASFAKMDPHKNFEKPPFAKIDSCEHFSA